jgi:hypothetical protein
LILLASISFSSFFFSRHWGSVGGIEHIICIRVDRATQEGIVLLLLLLRKPNPNLFQGQIWGSKSSKLI